MLTHENSKPLENFALYSITITEQCKTIEGCNSTHEQIFSHSLMKLYRWLPDSGVGRGGLQGLEPPPIFLGMLVEIACLSHAVFSFLNWSPPPFRNCFYATARDVTLHMSKSLAIPLIYLSSDGLDVTHFCNTSLCNFTRTPSATLSIYLSDHLVPFLWQLGNNDELVSLH